MPYKDKEKRNQASKDSMQRKREGLTLGVNKEGVNSEGSQDWETIPLEEIKEILPSNTLIDIIAISDYGRIRQRPIMFEERLRRAYKYQVQHDEDFINGIHKDSKYRKYVVGDLLKVTK